MLRVIALLAALCAAPSFAQWPGYFGGSSGGCVAGSACQGTTITATTQFLTSTAGNAGFVKNSGGYGIMFGRLDAADPSLFAGYGGAGTFYHASLPSNGALVFSNLLSSNTFYSSSDTYITRYAAKQLMISGDGTGGANQEGFILGQAVDGSGYSGLYSTRATPSTSNYILRVSNQVTSIGSYGGVGGAIVLSPNNSTKVQIYDTAGIGPSITAGTAAADVNALSLTQTLNGAIAFNTILSNVTVTSQTAGSLHLNLQRSGTLQFGVTNGANSTGTQVRTAQQTAPTCSSNCGTSPSVTGSDTAMTVTMGSSGVPASGWVVTFNGTWASAPACSVTPAVNTMAVGKMPIAVVTTTTTVTVTTNGTAPSTSDKYHVKCTGIS